MPGDTLVLYTDGFTETFADEEFGEQHLIEAVRLARGPSERRDDITLIVAKGKIGS